MLFDLRGRGRRRTVKVVYVTLAFLMGGGLVFFGIGGDVSGGLVDAITGQSGSSGDLTSRLEDRERAAAAKVRTNPNDAAAWAELARVRFQLASAGDGFDQANGTFTPEGKARLQTAANAWEKHLEVTDKPDERVASVMAQAYSEVGLNQPDKLVQTQEIITEARPSASTYTRLAIFAYQAGDTRRGDLAKNKALELTEDPKERRELRKQLDQVAAQAAVQQAQQGQDGAATPTPTPEPDK
jgi:hypothetical protein